MLAAGLCLRKTRGCKNDDGTKLSGMHYDNQSAIGDVCEFQSGTEELEGIHTYHLAQKG